MLAWCCKGTEAGREGDFLCLCIAQRLLLYLWLSLCSGWHPWNQYRRAQGTGSLQLKHDPCGKQLLLQQQSEQKSLGSSRTPQKCWAVRNCWWLSLTWGEHVPRARVPSPTATEILPVQTSGAVQDTQVGQTWADSYKTVISHSNQQDRLHAWISHSESELHDAASVGNGFPVLKMFASVAGTGVGKQQMSMRQTAKGITLECPGSAAKLSTFLVSVTARKSNTSGTGGVEHLGKLIPLSKFDFPFIKRVF